MYKKLENFIILIDISNIILFAYFYIRVINHHLLLPSKDHPWDVVFVALILVIFSFSGLRYKKPINRNNVFLITVLAWAFFISFIFMYFGMLNAYIFPFLNSLTGW